MKRTINKIGKIKSVRFGLGGYQDSQIGLHLDLGSDSWGVFTSESAWDFNIIKHSEYSKWSESDRRDEYADIMCKVSDLLAQAKVPSIDKLVGIPIEVTLEDNILKSWRILTEAV